MNDQPCIEAPIFAMLVCVFFLIVGETMLSVTALLIALSLALIYRIQVHHVVIEQGEEDSSLLSAAALVALALTLILPALAGAITGN